MRGAAQQQSAHPPLHPAAMASEAPPAVEAQPAEQQQQQQAHDEPPPSRIQVRVQERRLLAYFAHLRSRCGGRAAPAWHALPAATAFNHFPPAERIAPAEQVVVRVRPVLPHENLADVAVTCAPDGARVQVRLQQNTLRRRQLLVLPCALALNGRCAASAYIWQR